MFYDILTIFNKYVLLILMHVGLVFFLFHNDNIDSIAKYHNIVNIFFLFV